MRKTAALVLLLLATPLAAKSGADWLTAPGRAENDVKLDADRKPVAVLRFVGLKKGMSVLDYMSGGGYYAEIMAVAVGPKGQVEAWNPENFVATDKAQAKWSGLTTRHPNITHRTAAFDRFDAGPKRYDLALFHLVYHDLYWESDAFKVPKTDPDAVLGRLYAAMKPGGVVGVIDHTGPAGDTRQIVDKLHRIDPSIVKADFARAGFKLVGESPMLAASADDGSKDVFDPAIRGKTNRFVLKFIRPRK